MLCVTAFSKGWLRRRVLVCLECREENRPLSGQQHQAQFGINPALATLRSWYVFWNVSVSRRSRDVFFERLVLSRSWEFETSSSAIAERPRCSVGQMWPKYQWFRFAIAGVRHSIILTPTATLTLTLGEPPEWRTEIIGQVKGLLTIFGVEIHRVDLQQPLLQ